MNQLIMRAFQLSITALLEQLVLWTHLLSHYSGGDDVFTWIRCVPACLHRDTPQPDDSTYSTRQLSQNYPHWTFIQGCGRVRPHHACCQQVLVLTREGKAIQSFGAALLLPPPPNGPWASIPGKGPFQYPANILVWKVVSACVLCHVDVGDRGPVGYRQTPPWGPDEDHR